MIPRQPPKYNATPMTVVPFPVPPPPTPEPLIRLPPVTLALLIIMVMIHGGAALAALLLGDWIWLSLYTHFGFMPISLSQGSLWSVVTLVTAGFIHGGWLHLGVNTAMLAACGGGVERHLGVRWLLLLLLGGILIGNVTHFAFDPHSIGPLVGASGGISALFAACMLLLGPVSQRQIWVFLGIFIALSFLQMLMGGPGGEAIAGLAHIGGFIYGLGLTLWLRAQFRKGDQIG